MKFYFNWYAGWVFMALALFSLIASGGDASFYGNLIAAIVNFSANEIKNLGSIVKEELEYPAAEFKAVVKAKFQQDKVQQQIDKLTQSLETANSL